MKAELEYKLAEEFEFMRREPASSGNIIVNLYQAFGIDAGDGWYQLLYDMCNEIAEVLESAETPVRIVVDQIKEKFGALRFYYHLEGAEPERNDLYRKISDIVQRYEDLSEEICEICGCEGELRTDLIWIRTLCDACYSKCSEKCKKNRGGNDKTDEPQF